VSPADIEHLLQIGIAHHQAGRLGEAEAVYRQILAVQPTHPDSLHLLGTIAGQVGRFDLGAELIRRAIAASPTTPEFHCNLGLLFQKQRKCDQALSCFQQALALSPRNPQSHFNLATALAETGDLDQAIACYQQALALKPDYAEAHNNLGNAWEKKGKPSEAIASYQRALALQPSLSKTHNNLGNALLKQGLLDQSIACYQQAISLQPDYTEAHFNLGDAWRRMGRVDQAIASYRRALVLAPDSADAHNNLGAVLADIHQFDQAIACYERALTLKPNYPDFHYNLGHAFWNTAQIDQAIGCYRKALQLDPDSLVAHDSLLLALHHFPSSDPHSLHIERQRWNLQHAQPLKPFIPIHTNDRDPDRQLRIGYVSPDFRDHPVGRFILPLLAEHDRDQFQIFCYAQVPKPDEMTEKLRANSQTWRSIVGLSDEQTAELIRQDQIDILIDLAMHTANNSLLVFARKPAPVQVTYLAYAGGTALETIDYRLTDHHLDPAQSEDGQYVEKSIRLDGTYWCYQPSLAAAPVNELPALTNGKITFGCLNHFCKITQDTLETWAKLLLALSDARFLLHAPVGNHREILKRFLENQGIASDRLEFVARVSSHEYFQCYHRMDIALDPFPYAGGTTTCDALWMGVPVVTLAGSTAVARAGVSILANAGLPELIAHTPEQYIQLAVDLASNLPRLAELRRTLRPRLRKSSLMDAPRFARSIEEAYRKIWRSWCEIRPVEPP
jgi:protein O-GlcNAc transferase